MNLAPMAFPAAHIWPALWPVVPAMLLALGLALAARGLRRLRAAFPNRRASMQPLSWMTGFRLLLFGLALAGLGAAWLWQVQWLLWLSLAIGGEETLESLIAIAALRAQQRAALPPRRNERGAAV